MDTVPKAHTRMQRCAQYADYLQCKFPVRHDVLILWTKRVMVDETGAQLSAIVTLNDLKQYQILMSLPGNRTIADAVETIRHEWPHMMRPGGLRVVAHDDIYAVLYWMLYRDYYEEGGIKESEGFHWKEEV